MNLCILCYTHHHEQTIDNFDELSHILEHMKKIHPRIIWIKVPDFGLLTVAISDTYGCVHYESENSKIRTPTWRAELQNKEENINPISENDEFIEFSMEGIPTPLPIDICIPIEDVIEIVIYICKYKQLPSHINWIVDG